MTKSIKNTTCLEGIQKISYEGIVSVKLQNGRGKTLMSNQYHNTGMPNLFKFICTALAGEFTDALRPCKIKLFTYKEALETENSPGDFKWDLAFAKTTDSPEDASPFILYDAAPTISRESDGYTTTFHFRIPCSLISQGLVHMIGFFSNNIYNGREIEASAYYLLTDKVDGKIVWAPWDLTGVSGSYSLIIDWTMSVANYKDTKQNNSN